MINNAIHYDRKRPVYKHCRHFTFSKPEKLPNEIYKAMYAHVLQSSPSKTSDNLDSHKCQRIYSVLRVLCDMYKPYSGGKGSDVIEAGVS